MMNGILPASSSAWTELGSGRPVPPSEKLNPLKTQQRFSAPREKWGHRADSCRETGETDGNTEYPHLAE